MEEASFKSSFCIWPHFIWMSEVYWNSFGLTQQFQSNHFLSFPSVKFQNSVIHSAKLHICHPVSQWYTITLSFRPMCFFKTTLSKQWHFYTSSHNHPFPLCQTSYYSNLGLLWILTHVYISSASRYFFFAFFAFTNPPEAAVYASHSANVYGEPLGQLVTVEKLSTWNKLSAGSAKRNRSHQLLSRNIGVGTLSFSQWAGVWSSLYLYSIACELILTYEKLLSISLTQKAFPCHFILSFIYNYNSLKHT